MSAQLPIGVFDSGLGGLTVLKELSRALPNEHFIYLGDVARLPYGTKSAAVVERYARHCFAFLRSHGIKLGVIACNTATAVALEALRAEADIPIHGVIAPGARAGVATGAKRILVLATESTVKSEAYLREFHRLSPNVAVTQLACPLLVPLAEAGWFDHKITREVIKEYVDNAGEYDAVVMGCTHYPLLETSLRAVLGDIPLVHSGTALAEEVKQALAARGNLNPSTSPGTLRFFSTDHVSRRLPILAALFGKPIEFELVDL